MVCSYSGQCSALPIMQSRLSHNKFSFNTFVMNRATGADFDGVAVTTEYSVNLSLLLLVATTVPLLLTATAYSYMLMHGYPHSSELSLDQLIFSYSFS